MCMHLREYACFRERESACVCLFVCMYVCASERENFIINRSWSDSPTCALNHGHPPIALTLGCGGRSLDTRANIAPGVSCRVLLGHRRRHRVS